MSSAPSVSRPVPRPGILAIEAYVPGKSGAPGAVKVHKLSSNETPLGPSPLAIEAMREEAFRLALYPDGNSTRLREAIAFRYGLDPARIVCGAGSDELLSFLAYAYLSEGDEGIFTEHGFLVYRIAILAAGGTPVVVPERDLHADVDAILAAVTPRTEDRLPRQSQQPDRHLPALRRNPAPACGPTAERPPRPRRGLCRVRADERLQRRPRTGPRIRKTW